MIAEDAPIPPEGFLTPEEKETLTRLRQERHDAVREERELLLAARSREKPDYRLPKRSDEFEEVVAGMSPREREGFGLLQKHEFEKWGAIQERGFAAVRKQYELLQAVERRVLANFERGDAAEETNV